MNPLRMLTTAACFLFAPVAIEAANMHYPVNPDALLPNEFVALPLGAVKPRGWLKDQLTVQAAGLTGHLDEFWPSLTESAWKGGDGEGWERAPYYLDGLVPLAYLLDDPRLIEKVHGWTEWMLASGQPNGWFGPAKNNDRWPLAVALKVLTQYQEATGDERVIPLMSKYFDYLLTNPPDWPDKDWRGVRAMENAVSAYWLYRRTKNDDLLKVTESIHENSFDWTSYFLDFPYTTKELEAGIKHGHPSHVVNIAMAVKHPGVYYQQSKDDRHKRAVYEGLAALDRYHGQAAGRFSGDEHLSGTHPSQGTELCGVVEFMFSLENLVEVLGDPMFTDRLEVLAYNANPGACTADYWAHQYDQQANQVLCSNAKRQWSTNSDTSNLYGLEPHYGCCTANMHQGWPKFVSHMWMATHDQGLAAVAFGPSQVKAKVADGVEVTVTEDTEYPFDGIIRFTIDVPKPTTFPLYFRVPGWCDEQPKIQLDGEGPFPSAPSMRRGWLRVENAWRAGDVLTLTIPMKLRSERRYNNGVAVLRGPVYYALKIGEEYVTLASHHNSLPVKDYEIRATTPWNYGLVLDREDPAKSVEVTTRSASKVPFANDTAPVVLKVKGKPLPDWGMDRNSAAAPPPSPLDSDGPTADLELVPYGSTRLRITEFPVITPEASP